MVRRTANVRLTFSYKRVGFWLSPMRLVDKYDPLLPTSGASSGLGLGRLIKDAHQRSDLPFLQSSGARLDPLLYLWRDFSGGPSGSPEITQVVLTRFFQPQPRIGNFPIDPEVAGSSPVSVAMVKIH